MLLILDNSCLLWSFRGYFWSPWAVAYVILVCLQKVKARWYQSILRFFMWSGMFESYYDYGNSGNCFTSSSFLALYAAVNSSLVELETYLESIANLYMIFFENHDCVMETEKKRWMVIWFCGEFTLGYFIANTGHGVLFTCSISCAFWLSVWDTLD